VESQIPFAQISVWGLWPEALAIAAGGGFLTLANVFRLFVGLSSSRVRAASALGLVCCLYLFYLGLWPSIYSLAAIFVLPAAVALGVLLFRPSRFWNWPKGRIYLGVSVALSMFCAVTELIWLLHLRQ
jgi:hypothetical protein